MNKYTLKHRETNINKEKTCHKWLATRYLFLHIPFLPPFSPTITYSTPNSTTGDKLAGRPPNHNFRKKEEEEEEEDHKQKQGGKSRRERGKRERRQPKKEKSRLKKNK